MSHPRTELQQTLREFSFQLFDVLSLQTVSQRSRYQHHDLTSLTGVLESFVRLSTGSQGPEDLPDSLTGGAAGVIPEPLMALANGLVMSEGAGRTALFRTADPGPEQALSRLLAGRRAWRDELTRPPETRSEGPGSMAGLQERLLTQKTHEEAGVALALFMAGLAEDQRTAPDDGRKQQAAVLNRFLAPVLAWWAGPANRPYSAVSKGDTLIAVEQAVDFLGKRVWAGQSQGLQLWLQVLQKDLETAATGDGQQWALSLSETLQRAVRVTQQLGQALQSGDLAPALANSQRYLHLFGTMAAAWMWLRQGNAAARLLVRAAPEEQGFYRGKLQAARFFFHWQLPAVAQDLVLLQNQDNTCLDMRPEWY